MVQKLNIIDSFDGKWIIFSDNFVRPYDTLAHSDGRVYKIIEFQKPSFGERNPKTKVKLRLVEPLELKPLKVGDGLYIIYN